ncbi:MAG: hypothetical protein R3C05_14415 [Pirellulaceae bacterium]
MNAAEIQALLDAKHKERAAAGRSAPLNSDPIANETSEATEQTSSQDGDDMPLAFVGGDDFLDTPSDEPEPNVEPETESSPQEAVASASTDTADIDSVVSIESKECDKSERSAPCEAEGVAANQTVSTSTASSPLWMKLCLGSAACLAIAATTIGLINRNVLQAQLNQLASSNEDLLNRCRYNQTQCDLLMGNPGNIDRPFWNNRYHVLDLDREFFAQVPTSVGMVNVLRIRPASLNERHQLAFEITNPNVLKLHHGKLVIRTSDEAFDSSRRYDYDHLRDWLKSVKSTTYDLGDLLPGQTCRITASVGEEKKDGLRSIDNVEYVDFEVVFDYFSTQTPQVAADSYRGT